MLSEAPSCPECGQSMTRVADHAVRYRCPACQGQMLGLVPFEHILEDGMGARIWVASSEGAPGGPCPFCRRPMRQVPASDDRPPATAVCRTCEQGCNSYGDGTLRHDHSLIVCWYEQHSINQEHHARSQIL